MEDFQTKLCRILKLMTLLLNRASALTIIQILREMAFEHPRLDFDDESSMDDDDYQILTGFSRCE
jgi:hypothetical protein